MNTTIVSRVPVKVGSVNLSRWHAWGIFAIVLIVAPMIFNKGAALSVLSQMGTVMIFCLSFNMLFGQGGMLSFGHAVYSGLGGFIAIHAMNMVTTNGSHMVPVTLIPLVGGIAGMGFGILFGYVTTKKSGTTFAMITLGIVELVHSSSLMLPEFFGGEGGITTNRVYGAPFMGITYGPQIEVYYLIAFWLFVATVGMFAFTQTPLGRIINAVRDNPERVEFIGYDTQWVRYLTLILAAFFAGISGALSAINFEIVSSENVGAHASGAVLFFTFIGGGSYFFGPMIGAIIGVFLTLMLSDLTSAWQLYLGLFFILIVMYAPGGVASLIVGQARVCKYGKFTRVRPKLAAVLVAFLIALSGLVTCVEMLYYVTLESARGPVMELFHMVVDTKAFGAWFIAVGLLLSGGIGLRMAWPSFILVWDEVNSELEEQIRREQA